MTWMGALPVLVVAVIFDAVRLMFEMFWFFGPALAALYCATKVGDVAVIGGLLTKGCIAIAGVAGFFGSPAITAFGVVMAIAVGLLGWMTIGLILMMTNARIFKENAAWFVVSLAVSETPIIGSIPALTLTLVKMYSHQIKLEKAAMKKYEEEQGVAQAREQQQMAQFAQMQQIQAAQQGAANDAAYEQAATEQEIVEQEQMATEAANDAQYTQKKAA